MIGCHDSVRSNQKWKWHQDLPFCGIPFWHHAQSKAEIRSVQPVAEVKHFADLSGSPSDAQIEGKAAVHWPREKFIRFEYGQQCCRSNLGVKAQIRCRSGFTPTVNPAPNSTRQPRKAELRSRTHSHAPLQPSQ